jgi:hypothetical protein
MYDIWFIYAMNFEIMYKITNKVTELSVSVSKETSYGLMAGLELEFFLSVTTIRMALGFSEASNQWIIWADGKNKWSISI